MAVGEESLLTVLTLLSFQEEFFKLLQVSNIIVDIVNLMLLLANS